MALPCADCVTRDFCVNVMRRCMDVVLKDHYGEAEMQDQEELPAEDVEVKLPDFEEDVFDRRLSKREKQIIQRAIKGF